MNKKTIISFLVSILLVGLLLTFVNLQQVIQKIVFFSLPAFVLSGLIFIPQFILHGIKWKLIIDSFKKISYADSTNILMVGYFANNLLPARAGEFVRAIALSSRTGMGKAVSLSTVLVDRITDVIALLALFFLSLLFAQKIPQDITLTALALLAFFCLILLIMLKAGKFSKYLPFGIEKIFETLSSASHSLKGKQGAKIWLFSVLAWLAQIPFYYFVLGRMGINAGIPETMFLTAIISLSALIPSAPGYIGTFEAASVLALQLLGIDINTATSFAIISHLSQYIFTMLFGIVSLNLLSMKFYDISKNTK